ncbi:MAG TPA: signal peptidase II [Ignavibacteriaceae bacterium]|nr:signal peptidase II [Ignavibacteriaceae bacterium]
MRVLFISLIVIVLDQVSKVYVKGISLPIINFKIDGMYPGEIIPVIGEFFRITFIENPGLAFGFDPGIDFKLAVSVFSVIASIGLLFYLFKIKDQKFPLRISIAFILGGAIGNLIDRVFYGVFYGYAPLFYGKVVDFFDVDFFDFSLLGKHYDRWPIFNIADASVTIGVLILLIFYNFHKKEETIQSESASATGSMLKDGENTVEENNPSEKPFMQSSEDEQDNKSKDIQV